jgi:5-(carboxyamino)imidazole ribonucleotide synthase
MKRSILVLGNGQLGLLLGRAAQPLGIDCISLSIPDVWTWLERHPDPSQYCVTFEQEHVDGTLLAHIERIGAQSFPSWHAFQVLSSKRRQKELLNRIGLATAPWIAAETRENTLRFLQEKKGGILKAGRGGYDGKGVWSFDSFGKGKKNTLDEVWPTLREPYVEEKIEFDSEWAAVVVRSATGEILRYPTVRSIQREGICFQVEYSQELASTALAQRAGEWAEKIAKELNYVGTLAVEFFAKGEELLVNEIAPRVHNSGHFTIDLCSGSQFENHLRAGLGMPLGSTKPTHNAALMVNLLWPPQETDFAPLFTKLSCGPPWPPEAKLHWYGKSEPRPLRKMGHFTVYGDNLASCRALADQILASRWA